MSDSAGAIWLARQRRVNGFWFVSSTVRVTSDAETSSFSAGRLFVISIIRRTICFAPPLMRSWVTLMGTGKTTVGDEVTPGSGVALSEVVAEGARVGSGSEVKEHPASSTTIAMAMTRRRLTDPAYFGRWFRP